MSETTKKMEKTFENLNSQLRGIRTSRATPDLLNPLQVDYYGSMVPINQVASVSVPESRLLLINVFDKGAVQAVEKAIQSSELGLTPQTEGTMIRLRLPDLTEERRKEIVKHVRKLSEESKVAIRNIRRDAIDEIKAMEKKNELTEDDVKREQLDIQNTTDMFIQKIETSLKSKEKEILTI